jgi:hypothetical protein
MSPAINASYSAEAPTQPSRLALAIPRGVLIVGGAALAARLLFAILIGGTYDYDEFVILLLGRDLSHGAVAYRDFMFFHPPGVLMLMRLLQPVVGLWWPAARLVSVVADTGTAILVWVIARRLFDERAALAAGLLYALSPLALTSSARIGQDPLITLLGVAGLALLVTSSSRRASLGAGILLGLAMWIKYPAAYFLPIYLLAAPRRAAVYLPAAVATFGVLLLPFHDQLSLLYSQTVTFQRSRWLMDPTTRVGTVVLYWLVLNVPAVIGLWRTRRPLWLVAGFLMGVLFIFPSQVYYHYFVPIVPFAALLGARPAAGIVRWNRWKVAVVAAAVLGLWATIIDAGGTSPLFVTAARLSSIQPTIALLRSHTGRNQPVLADRFEYAYLAERPALMHYFWNVGVLVDARYLEARTGNSGAIVLSHGASSGYPAGFLHWLDRRYVRIETPVTTVWLTKNRAT